MGKTGGYYIFLNDEIREKSAEDMKSFGFTSLAGFIRMLLLRFPNFGGNGKWTDQDMLDFARSYSHREPNPPTVIESEDRQLQKALDKFKSTK
jgi:hypothetical protein